MHRSTHALVAAALIALTGCGPANDPVDAVAAPSPTPSPSPSPSPSPTPSPLPPVAGERLPSSADIGDGERVEGKDTRDAVDEDAVRAFADAIFDWLDAHLDDLQRGGEGRLADIDGAGVAAGLDDAQRAALTTALANPDQRVAAATYELTAYHDATIEFASVVVTVIDPIGVNRSVTLAFTPGAEGAPQLSVASLEVRQ